MGEWISCFTDISTQEGCRVTQKLDLDQMSERSILYNTHFLLQILGLFVSFRILGKWLQKEDIAETAVHFVLKWGFEVNPVSNNSRIMETEDLGDIASTYMPLKQSL